MAAERTPGRRKQCIFRRTLQRFPFGKCERRSGGGSSSSSYAQVNETENDWSRRLHPWECGSLYVKGTDIHHGEKSSYTPAKWSPMESSTSSFNSQQPVHREALGSGMRVRNQLQSVEPTNSFYGGCEDSMALEPMSGIDHVSNLAFFQPHHLPHHHMNSVATIGLQDGDSAYSSESITEDGTTLPVVSPPSPSIYSMEMDVGVDPETGERAMD